MAKPCTKPGCVQEKKAGHPLWCPEDWVAQQKAEVQEDWSRQRLAAVPAELRRSRVVERDWPPGRRWCSGCQSFVRLEDVPKGAARCAGCAKAAQRGTYVETVYGITKAEEDAIWEAQGRRCAVCRREVHSKRPAVDHDHATGEVRGLLCPDVERGCNRAILGSIEAAARSHAAQVAMVRRLLAYLEDPPARAVLARLRRS